METVHDLRNWGEGFREQFAVVSSVLNDISLSVKFSNSFPIIKEFLKEIFQ